MKNRGVTERVGRSFLGLFLAAFFSVAIALPASGATVPTKTTGATALCPQSNLSSSVSQNAASNYLPANRWLGALGVTHTDLSLGFNISNDIAYAQRNGLISPLMSIGNAEWGLGISSTEFANNFCIQSSIGTAIDSASAKFDTALKDGNIAVIIAVIALVALLVGRIRGRGKSLVGGLMRIIVVLAVFSIMLNASANATPQNPEPAGSPSWLLNAIYGTVNTVTSKPTELMASAMSGVGVNNGGQVMGDPLNCYYYNEVLVDTYDGSKGGISAANGGSAGVGSNYASVPVALNTLWEGLAVPTYVEEQFGNNNNFGTLMYCHLLEQNAGIRPRYQAQIQNAAIALSTHPSLSGAYNQSTGTVSGGILGTPLASSASALAWNGAISNPTQDESIVGWAACQTNSTNDTPMEWDVQDGAIISPSEWTTVVNNQTPMTGRTTKTVEPQDCQAFFETPVHANGGTTYGTPTVMGSGSKANSDYSIFNWNPATPANIASATSGSSVSVPFTIGGLSATTINGSQYGAGVADFLNNIHGTSNTNAEAAAMLFVLSSTVITVVFFGLSMALLISKIALLLLLLMLPIMLLFMLLPFANSDGKFLAMAKKTLSLVIFSTSVGLVLSVIAGISAMLAAVGSALAGPGSIFALLWVGVCPLVSIYIIHMFFKKVIKAPSPFKPSGMAGYAASATTLGAIGGAELGSHWEKVRRMGVKAMTPQRLGGTRPGSSVDGERRSRRGNMSGGGRSTPTTEGAPTGGAPGAPATPGAPGAPEVAGAAGGTSSTGAEAGSPPTSAQDAATVTEAGGSAALGGSTMTRREAVREKLKDFATSAQSRFNARDESGDTHRVKGAKDTARSAAKKLVRGARYVAPHPLEGLHGMSVRQKVHTVAKRSAKYAAIGAVGLAAAPATASVAALAAGSSLVIAAVAAKRKLRDHRLGVTSPSPSVNPLAPDTPDDSVGDESKEVDPSTQGPQTERSTEPKPRYSGHWEGEGADRHIVYDEEPTPRTIDVDTESGPTVRPADESPQPSRSRTIDADAPTGW